MVIFSQTSRFWNADRLAHVACPRRAPAGPGHRAGCSRRPVPPKLAGPPLLCGPARVVSGWVCVCGAELLLPLPPPPPPPPPLAGASPSSVARPRRPVCPSCPATEPVAGSVGPPPPRGGPRPAQAADQSPDDTTVSPAKTQSETQLCLTPRTPVPPEGRDAAQQRTVGPSWGEAGWVGRPAGGSAVGCLGSGGSALCGSPRVSQRARLPPYPAAAALPPSLPPSRPGGSPLSWGLPG